MKKLTTKTLLGVDTVRITLSGESFKILDFKRFKRTANAFVFNSAAIDKELGLYLPHLHYTTRTNFSNTPMLYIECSLPKIAFGNNLQELTTDDKNLVLQNLYSALGYIGVKTSINNLLGAMVSRIDVGKNIIVPNTTIALKEMNNMLPRNRKFSEKIKYENNGKGIRFKNASFEFVAYDKLSDPLLPKKYRFDEDFYSQSELLSLCKKHNIQILRFEGRFMKREHVKKMYQSYDIKNPVFNDVFRPEIAYEIVNQEWNKLISCYVPTPHPSKTILELATDLLRDNRDVSLRNLLAGLSIRQLLAEVSFVQLKELFRNHSSAETVRHIFTMGHQIKYSGTTGQDTIASISSQMLEWQPLCLPLQTTILDDNPKNYNINKHEENPKK